MHCSYFDVLRGVTALRCSATAPREVGALDSVCPAGCALTSYYDLIIVYFKLELLHHLMKMV